MRPGLAIAAVSLLAAASAFAAERPIRFSQTAQVQGALAVPLGSRSDLARAPVDEATRAAIGRALDLEAFNYQPGSTLSIGSVGSWSRLLVVGTGSAPLTAAQLQDLGGTAAQELGNSNGPITIAAGGLAGAANAGSEIAIGARLGSYRFDRYKSVDPAISAAGKTAPITILGASEQARDDYERRGRPLSEAVAFARDLATEPANVLYPETFVERTQRAFQGVAGIRVRALDVPAMERLGMGSILSVGRGSARPSRMLLVEYRGGGNAAPIVLAGKGITFDSGGISLKPGLAMWEMKGDMGGGAVVVATVLSLARSRAPVNVVAVAALAENMPGGSATRPGDVVRAMNGKTIEILNTDAEGRLVLADAVAFAEREYRPAAIVDVATLTGAVGAALGDEYAGLLSRDESLVSQLVKAGSLTGEELWRLPLHPNYAKDMRSDVADIKNVVEGGTPGAGFGAHFIGYFIERTPWAHLDIAGMDLRKQALPTVPKGYSAFGVRLLDRFVRDFRPSPEQPTAVAAN